MIKNPVKPHKLLSINEKQKAIEAAEERARIILKDWLIKQDTPKISVEEYDLSLRKSERLIINQNYELSMTDIPEEFIKVIVELPHSKAIAMNLSGEVVIDNAGLKAWLKKGNAIVDARIENFQNLQIK